MKLEHEFYKLPLLFDVKRLNKELSTFAESDWQKHPSDYKGNLAIPLISVNGGINDAFAGPMQATKFLEQSPYIQQVIASFESVFGRSRLMRLEGRHEVPLHSDINYHWYSRVRIHVPIVTTPDVIFHCGEQQVHMAPGEAWIFDAWKMHKVVNPSGSTRVHLVIDTAGSSEFWALTDKAETFSAGKSHESASKPDFVKFEPSRKFDVPMERYNVPLVMSPGEVDALVNDIIQDTQSVSSNSSEAIRLFWNIAKMFQLKWRSIWSSHGPDRSGWKEYEQLITETQRLITTLSAPILSNLADAAQVLNARVIGAAFHPELEAVYGVKEASATHGASRTVSQAGHRQEQNKVGRNSPCPCGSGKKYKRCHGA